MEEINVDIADPQHQRFSGAPWFEVIQNIDVVIYGCGGIGSWAALQLSRLNPSCIILYDPDKVEAVNLAGQLYKFSDIGVHKTRAVKDSIKAYSDYYRTDDVFMAVPRGKDNYHSITVCGFDNMDSRKAAFDDWERCNPDTSIATPRLFIDGRMSADTIQVFAMCSNDEYARGEYRNKWLFDDSEADSSVCSYKQTSFVAGMIGSLIANLVVNFMCKYHLKLEDYQLPFKTTFNSKTLMLEGED